MSVAAIKYVSDLMDRARVPYAFMEWKDTLPDDLFSVGEVHEISSPTMEESGRQDVQVFLRLYTKKDWLSLEYAKERIMKSIIPTAILNDGTGIAVFYDSATIVPTGDAELKSMKINLTMQLWKVI